MSDIKELHNIIMQQAQTIAKLTEQIVSYVQTGQVPVPQTPKEAAPQYDVNLKGSDLVREHFRRGGGKLLCFIDDGSDEEAIECGSERHVAGVEEDKQITDYPFLTAGCNWKYAVACTPTGRVLTASELLG